MNYDFQPIRNKSLQQTIKERHDIRRFYCGNAAVHVIGFLEIGSSIEFVLSADKGYILAIHIRTLTDKSWFNETFTVQIWNPTIKSLGFIVAVMT